MTCAIAALASDLRHLLRHEALDDLDLGTLAVGQFLAAGLVVDLDQFLALLDHLLQDAEQIIVGERFPRTFLLDLGVLDRRIDEAQRRDAPLVARLHGVLQG